MNLALVLSERQPGSVPAVGMQPGALVHRQSEVVAQLRTRPTLGLIFVNDWTPIARKVELSERRTRRAERREQQERLGHNSGAIGRVHISPLIVADQKQSDRSSYRNDEPRRRAGRSLPGFSNTQIRIR